MPDHPDRPPESKPSPTTWLHRAATDLESVWQRHFLALHRLQQLQQQLNASKRPPRHE